jgi:HEPN domain-containing protein
MNKADHIQYWKRTAADSWLSTQTLFDGKRYVESVFWVHLTLEKLLKAHWVKDNLTDIAPRVHNLLFLLGQTSLTLTIDEIIFLKMVDSFQMDGRYPDYTFKIDAICTQPFTRQLLDTSDQLQIKLLSLLP